MSTDSAVCWFTAPAMMRPSVTLCTSPIIAATQDSKTPLFSPVPSQSQIIAISDSSDSDCTELSIVGVVELPHRTKHLTTDSGDIAELVVGDFGESVVSDTPVPPRHSSLDHLNNGVGSVFEHISAVSDSSLSEHSEAHATIENFSPQPVLSMDQIISYRQVYMKDVASEEMKSCSLCGFLISNHGSESWTFRRVCKYMTRHMKIKHSIVGMECGSCEKTMIPEHRIPCSCKSCLVCAEKFQTIKDLKQHARSQHILINMKEYKRLVPHVQPEEKQDTSSTGCATDKYHCLLARSCTYSSNNKTAYVRHMAVFHHIVRHRKPPILQCPICSFKFAKLGKISRHIRTYHMGETKHWSKHGVKSTSTMSGMSNSISLSNIICFEDDVDVVGLSDDSQTGSIQTGSKQTPQ